ncbi:transcription factor MYB1R1-like [Diospyros lotus]|uniref:transcription factor MYB1R1-like n=1 Tax=Diospyros lotus TaxID=55363 RepID=UPI002253FC8B|nr:transcription factor MYB1R1-like [Diospyros lotus]
MPKSDANAGEEKAAGEIMLFGVRVKVDPMRKSVSLNDLSQYVQPNESPNVNDPSAAAAAAGYASADEAVNHQSSGNRERKRGVPWTEEEHKLFLLGLQKVGKGDWRGISRNFVKTRTPTQVASHAQKYFLRRSNLNRRRRRSSLFDITTDTVTAIPMEEEKGLPDGKIQPLLSPETSSISGSQVLPYPVAVGPVLVPVQIENPMEKLTLRQLDRANNEPANLIRPIPVLPIPNPKIMTDLNLNQRLMAEPEPLSLQLSLSADLNQLPRHSAFQVLSSVSNGDSIISVA